MTPNVHEGLAGEADTLNRGQNVSAEGDVALVCGDPRKGGTNSEKCLKRKGTRLCPDIKIYTSSFSISSHQGVCCSHKIILSLALEVEMTSC